MTRTARFAAAFLLAIAIAIAVGRVAAIEDGVQAVADDLNDAITTAQVAEKGKP